MKRRRRRRNAAMVVAPPEPVEKKPSNVPLIALGVGAAAVVGMGLYYLYQSQGGAFTAGVTWGPNSFQLTPQARALNNAGPISVGQFALVTDTATKTPIVVEVSDTNAGLAKGVIASVGVGSAMKVGQTAAFNVADAVASSPTLATLTQTAGGAHP
jgi:hypothetical protein